MRAAGESHHFHVSARTRQQSTAHLYMVLIATAVGLCGAIGAVAFRFLIRFVQATAFEGTAGIETPVRGRRARRGRHDPLTAARALDLVLAAIDSRAGRPASSAR